jgi:hypothetical protein
MAQGFLTLKKGSSYMAGCKECIHDKVCLHKANIQTDTYAYMGVNYDTEKCEHYQPTADVVPKSEVAELLRLMFNDDCACNYNGNDEWLPFKCKYALTDCPTPPERLGCWMEFVEYGLAELKKKYTDGE